MDKLRFKKEEPVLVIGNDEYKDSMEGYETVAKAAKLNEQVLIFAKDKKTLETYAGKVLDKLAPTAVFWVAYPKKSGSMKSDITRDNGWEAIMGKGFEPVMQVSIDADWSALRFKRSEAIKDKIRDIPMSERQTEGVDYINRTVELPTDASKALKAEGLLAFFNAMSFSHKKEYVMAITEAKKEETRKRRIEKMVEMVYQLKEQKKK